MKREKKNETKKEKAEHHQARLWSTAKVAPAQTWHSHGQVRTQTRCVTLVRHAPGDVSEIMHSLAVDRQHDIALLRQRHSGAPVRPYL